MHSRGVREIHSRWSSSPLASCSGTLDRRSRNDRHETQCSERFPSSIPLKLANFASSSARSFQIFHTSRFPTRNTINRLGRPREVYLFPAGARLATRNNGQTEEINRSSRDLRLPPRARVTDGKWSCTASLSFIRGTPRREYFNVTARVFSSFLRPANEQTGLPFLPRFHSCSKRGLVARYTDRLTKPVAVVSSSFSNETDRGPVLSPVHLHSREHGFTVPKSRSLRRIPVR